MNRVKWLFISLLIIVAYSCNDYIASDYPVYTSSRGVRNSRGTLLSYSHEDSIEATEFALWYAGQLRPPDSLTTALLFSLNYLRYVFGDSVRADDSISVPRYCRFLAPWAVSELVIAVDDSTASKINLRQYEAWNKFKEYLRPVQYGPVDVLGIVVLKFNGFLNPRRLADLYSQLPGIRWAEPDQIGFADGNFPIFPRFDGEDWSYVFTLYREDGPVWYFKYVHGVPHYVGVRKPRDPEPTWWSEASLNLDVVNFIRWDGPPH